MDVDTLLGICSFKTEAIMLQIRRDCRLNDLHKKICKRWNYLSPPLFDVKYVVPESERNMVTLFDDPCVELMYGVHSRLQVSTIEMKVEYKELEDNEKEIIIKRREGAAGCPTCGCSSGKKMKDPINEEDDDNEDEDEDEDGIGPNTLDAWKCLIKGVGQEFKDAIVYRNALKKYAIANGFDYRYMKNDKSRVTVKCMNDSCPWRIHASTIGMTKTFRIKTLKKEHTCGGGIRTRDHPKASKHWVADLIKRKVKDYPNLRPKDIKRDILEQYGIDLPYHKAWHGRETARTEVHGNDEYSYDDLRWYCNAVRETNLGSKAEYEFDPITHHFKQAFISFHAAYTGFLMGCRPLIFLDGTFLKNKYRGTVLAATAVDANGDMFHIAMGVVDLETIENWEWFLMQLKETLETEQHITFVSDRNRGLMNSIRKAFPNSDHAYCLRHIKENFKSTVLRRFRKYEREVFVKKLTRCAYVPNVRKFWTLLNHLKRMTAPYSYAFFNDADPEHWATALFPGARFGFMNTNIAETFNSWILEARNLPVTRMIDTVRTQMMEMFQKRRNIAMQWEAEGRLLCPKADMKIRANIEQGRTYIVYVSDDTTYEVRGKKYSYIVDLQNWTCSCKYWQARQYPCSHACACIQRLGLSIYNFCESFITVAMYRKAYVEAIRPIPDLDMPPFDKSKVEILPPETKKQPGRPKKKRIPSIGEGVKYVIRCGRCGKQDGHNRQTCNEPISEK